MTYGTAELWKGQEAENSCNFLFSERRLSRNKFVKRGEERHPGRSQGLVMDLFACSCGCTQEPDVDENSGVV